MTKHALSRDHRLFFEKNRYIEFEHLLPPAQLQDLLACVQQEAVKRLGLPLNRELCQIDADDLFLKGYDLWRGQESLRKTILQPKIADIASELIGVHPLRIGFDQLLNASSPKPSLFIKPTHYDQLLMQTSTLTALSSQHEIAAGVLICLEAKEPCEESLLPKMAGHALFFAPDWEIPLPDLKKSTASSYLLIAYAEKTSRYMLTETDPHTHALKSLGYIFGDLLTDKLNPQVTTR